MFVDYDNSLQLLTDHIAASGLDRAPNPLRNWQQDIATKNFSAFRIQSFYLFGLNGTVWVKQFGQSLFVIANSYPVIRAMVNDSATPMDGFFFVGTVNHLGGVVNKLGMFTSNFSNGNSIQNGSLSGAVGGSIRNSNIQIFNRLNGNSIPAGISLDGWIFAFN